MPLSRSNAIFIHLAKLTARKFCRLIARPPYNLNLSAYFFASKPFQLHIMPKARGSLN